MKKTFWAGALLLSSAAAHAASDHLGKIGPFEEGAAQDATLRLTACVPSPVALEFFAEKSSAHHVPRIRPERVTAVFGSGAEESWDAGTLGSVKGFTLSVDRSGDCLKEVALRASAAGFHPSRINTVVVSVWIK